MGKKGKMTAILSSRPQLMRILLAPMEGVVDYLVRDILTQIGGIDGCVTEFVRITNQPLPNRVFTRLAPELAHASRTPSGVPVKLQLLGGNPIAMAENARRAVRAGATAIDLNFGCPSKTVNNSDGGASLLREPERIYTIVKAVRDALPQEIPVSAKIRLGFDNRDSYLDNAEAVAKAGATELVVHARSKADGYKPPAYWHCIAEIRQHVAIHVVANGEIWTLNDYLQCQKESNCRDVMIGRGLLARPDLALQIKAHVSGAAFTPMTWQQVCALLYKFHQVSLPIYPPKHTGNRIKQWLMYLQRTYTEAAVFFEEIKRERDPDIIEAAFMRQINNVKN